MMKKFTILTAVFLLVAAVGVSACGDSKSETASTKSITAQMASLNKGGQVDIEGQLVCLGCSLKKSEGAHAECSTYGHKHALKTTEGVYLTLLENKQSADLVKGEKYHNKLVSIHGVYHANANTLDVESFTVDGKTKSWCGGCKSMDGCSAGK